MRHKTSLKGRRGGSWGGRKQCVQLQGPSPQQACTFHRSLQKSTARCSSTMLRPGGPMSARYRRWAHLASQTPLPRSPSAPSPARAHRVGSVAGPERRQCEGRWRAGPSSCPGDPGSGARGRRQRAAAVPCPACGEQKCERGGQLRPLGQRACRGGGPSARPAPPPVLLEAEAIKS